MHCVILQIYKIKSGIKNILCINLCEKCEFISFTLDNLLFDNRDKNYIRLPADYQTSLYRNRCRYIREQ